MIFEGVRVSAHTPTCGLQARGSREDRVCLARDARVGEAVGISSPAKWPVAT